MPDSANAKCNDYPKIRMQKGARLCPRIRGKLQERLLMMIWKSTTFGLLASIFLVSTNLYGAEMLGVDVFIKACQNQGLYCSRFKNQ